MFVVRGVSGRRVDGPHGSNAKIMPANTNGKGFLTSWAVVLARVSSLSLVNATWIQREVSPPGGHRVGKTAPRKMVKLSKTTYHQTSRKGLRFVKPAHLLTVQRAFSSATPNFWNIIDALLTRLQNDGYGSFVLPTCASLVHISVGYSCSDLTSIASALQA